MKNVKKLLLNTLLLTATALFMRTVGMAFNVYLTNRIGSAGIGLFQLIMSVYSMSVTFASSGIRLAATRLVIEELSSRNGQVRAVMWRCVLYGLLVGSTVAMVLYLGADWISQTWLGDTRTKLPLQLLAVSLPCVAMSSSLGGYFTAVRKVGRYSAVQVAEQLIRVVATAFLLTWFLPGGLEYACVAIVLGSCLSDVLSFVCSFLLYRRDIRPDRLRGPRERRNLAWRMLRIAVPDAVGAWARSILLTIEHLLIPSGLKKAGASNESALATYGVIQGMVLPVLLFPSSILNSLASLLVPEVAECHAKGHIRQIRYISQRVLRITLYFGLGVAGCFYLYAADLSQAIYHNGDSTRFIQVLAPLVPVMYLDMTVDGLLKGLNQQVSSMRYNIIDSFLCVILVYFLVPRCQIQGYVITIFVSELINFVLSFRCLVTISPFEVNLFHDLLKPLLCLGGTLFCAGRLLTTWNLWSAIAVTLILYMCFLCLTGCITGEDIHWFCSIFRSERPRGRRILSPDRN